MNILLMPFIDESQSFTNGFECGIIWDKVESGECFEKRLVHTCNLKQIEMICDSFGTDFKVEIINDEWAYLTVESMFGNP